MDMNVVLERIAARLVKLERTEAEVSRRATGSPDTIRNWRRRAKKENNPGASTATIEPVARELGVTTAWLGGAGPDDYEDMEKAQSDRDELMALYDDLDPALQAVAAETIRALRSAKRR